MTERGHVLAKAMAAERIRLLIAAALALALTVGVAVVQFSTQASPAAAKSVIAADATTPAGTQLSAIVPLNAYLKAKQALERGRVRQAKAARAALQRARLVKMSRSFARPITSYRLTAGFGSRSRLWGKQFHTGQDFAAPYGTRVRAAEAGRVVFAGWDGSYGRKIAISHGGGTETWYGHLSRINVKVGQRVKVGQLIGRVGATGNVTGPHLHFEVRRYGNPINPVKWLRSMGIWV